MTEKRHDPRLVHRMFNFGNWHMTFWPFFGFLTQAEGNLLCLLINQQQRWSREEEEWHPDNWFYCKVRTIQNVLFMGKRTQSYILNSLAKKKLIKFEKRGFPPKRYIQINYAKIEECVNKVFLEAANRKTK